MAAIGAKPPAIKRISDSSIAGGNGGAAATGGKACNHSLSADCNECYALESLYSGKRLYDIIF